MGYSKSKCRDEGEDEQDSDICSFSDDEKDQLQRNEFLNLGSSLLVIKDESYRHWEDRRTEQQKTCNHQWVFYQQIPLSLFIYLLSQSN